NIPAPLPVTATALTARTLTVSGWSEAWLQQAAADFDAANPGVRVVLHPEDPNSILRLEYEIDHGKAPDVVLLEASHFQSLLAKGREDKFSDLAPFLAMEKDIKAGDFYPNILDYFSKGGKLYGLPR